MGGILFYAKTDESVTQNFSFNMSGNWIGARTLDLNTDFKVIATQLDNIAFDYFQIKAAE